LVNNAIVLISIVSLIKLIPSFYFIVS